MTKLLGSLVGTPKASAPMTPVDNAYERVFDETIVRDTITLAAAAATTTIQAAVVGWDTVLDPDECKIHCAALGANVTFSFGDATHPTALDNAVALGNAAFSGSLLSAISIGNYFQPLWQALGYATLAAAQAVAAQCELLFTINTAAATGVITWRLRGVRRS